MTFTLKIDDMDNEAFSHGKGREVARILRETAKKVEDAGKLSQRVGGRVMDVNGNAVGTWGVEE